MGRGTSWWQLKGERTRKMEKGKGQGEKGQGEKGNEANGRKKDPEIRPIGCRGMEAPGGRG